jgi:hypothetical protein
MDRRAVPMFREKTRGGMLTAVRRAVEGVRKTTEVIVALMFGLMFVAFILQIILRYSRLGRTA